MTKQLVVHDSVSKRLEAIDPNQATGIALPSFRVGANRPATGAVAGEAFLETTSHTAFVWTGNLWEPIVPTALLVYPTDSAVLADTAQTPGSYAASQATGNLFIKSASGWHQVGIRSYPTAAGLLADTPPDGQISVALDENTFWLRSGGNWICESTRPFADINGVTAWAPLDGAEAIEHTHDTIYVRSNGQWHPRGTWVSPEATILANTDMLAGQIAIASDTGRMWVRTAAGWEGSPVRHYATQVLLLADAPPDGVIAWADDTNAVYARGGGNWVRMNAPTVTVADIPPATPASGDLLVSPTNKTVQAYDGAAFFDLAGIPVGSIIAYASTTPPSGYLLCDGAAIPAGTQYDALRALVGANTPDLRDQFIRGARTQAQINGFTKHLDTTRRPRNTNLSGTALNAGNHGHAMRWSNGTTVYANTGNAVASTNGDNNWTNRVDGSTGNNITADAGLHNHNVTINAGGDSETAPVHVRLAYIIKY